MRGPLAVPSEQALREGVLRVGDLTGADANAFLLRECSRVSAGSAKGRVAELRLLLRFCYLRQLLPTAIGRRGAASWGVASRPSGYCQRGRRRSGDRQLRVYTLQGRRNPGDHAVGRTASAALDRGSPGSNSMTRLAPRWSRPAWARPARQESLPCPARSAKPSAPTSSSVARSRARGVCSSPAARRAGRSARTWSTTSWSGPVWPPASGGSGRTGCGACAGWSATPQGSGLRAIGQVLRHQDLATTALYARLTWYTPRGHRVALARSDRRRAESRSG